MITARTFNDSAGWDALLLRLPMPHPLQSDAWAAHKRSHGWQSARWVYTADGQVRGAALVLRRRVGPFSILYLPKGPLLYDWSDSHLVHTVMAHLQHLAHRQRALFVKIDPDVDYAPVSDLCAAQGETLAFDLTCHGWRFSADQIQYRNTALLDLRPDEETLLAGMKPKTRYNIRLAERKGVVVRAGGVDDLSAFYRLYAETGARDGFLIRSPAYYRSAWETFLQAGQGRLLLAECPGEAMPLAGVFLFHFGRRAWYIYGASSSQKRELMPNYLLQWEAIRWARAQGCDSYDLWGAPNTLSEDDPLWGVFRFKEGLGSVLVRHIGAWDYAPSRPLYWLYTVAIPRYLNLLRRRSPSSAGG